MEQFQTYGYGYGQPGPWNAGSINVDSRSFCQTLTEEEMKSLIKAQEEFTLGVTKEEQLRAICMHRDIEGHNMLDVIPQTGRARCKICGKEFTFMDNCSDDRVAEATQNLIDVIQSTKALYIDMPNESAKRFYTILALLEKVPGLYKVASENFSKHEAALNTWRVGQTSAVNEYNMLYANYNPMMMGGMGMAPNMGYPYQNPAMMNMGQGMPMQNQGNPFGFNGAPVQQPAPMYTPQMQGYAYSAPGMQPMPMVPSAVPAPPAVPTPAPAEAAPATPATENVEVTTQFQA